MAGRTRVHGDQAAADTMVAIRSYIKANGKFPTVRELCAELDLTVATVYKRLQHLVAKGLLAHGNRNEPRGYSVTDGTAPTYAELLEERDMLRAEIAQLYERIERSENPLPIVGARCR